MDSIIAAAGRALAVGDVLGALNRVALREDPPALALRGIAMAQLGEHARARELLRRAARGFGAHEERARARCIVAEAEVALAMRDLRGSPRALEAAATVLEARGDRRNAIHARVLGVRRLLLLGRLADAAAALSRIDVVDQPAALVARAELASAELALRSLRTTAGKEALVRAAAAADRADVPALAAEVAEAHAALDRPAARCGNDRLLRLDDVEALFASGTLVVDACRRGLRAGEHWIAFVRRPLLFALLHELASAWPGDASRNALIAGVFRTRRPDETHRARLRVEIGRLRALVRSVARIDATKDGFALVPLSTRGVVVLTPPIVGEQASLLALLSDGAPWSTSALALALQSSQRTVQRALVELQAMQKVRSIGNARARRWLAPPLTGFATTLLLPAALPLA